MTIDTLVILGGAFVALLPFMGFPASWDRVFLLLAGVFIVSLGIALRRRRSVRGAKEHKTGAFVENMPTSNRVVGLEAGEHDPY